MVVMGIKIIKNKRQIGTSETISNWLLKELRDITFQRKPIVTHTSKRFINEFNKAAIDYAKI